MKKAKIKEFIPPFVLRKVAGLFYGWHGDYTSWERALNKCEGYNSTEILNRVRESSLRVKYGSAVYERDSMIFDHIEYSFPLLSGLLWIAGINNGKLNVLDFGGALGSSYFQNKLFLDSLQEVNWCIIEQTDFVRRGIEEFENDHLHFFNSVNECLEKYDIQVVLLSSVIQYIEEPYKLLHEIFSHDFKHIIIDRTPFIKGKDRITIQKVNPRIYTGSYPCWFFNEQKFLSCFASRYNLIVQFDALDKANITSEFKGFIFQKLVNN